MTPICLISAAIRASSRLTTITPESARANRPKAAIASSSSPMIAACGCFPGGGTCTHFTAWPLLSSQVLTLAATLRTCAGSNRSPLASRRRRSSTGGSPSAASVSLVT